ncbi:MAG: DUF1232 domain-containing protein [Akkermansia sp.]|nr:DUF1232 domain-containing protein [Akkermansia sp.]
MESSINSIKDLENSKWMQEASKSEAAETLPTQVHTWLNTVPSTSKIATLAMRALQLYRSGSKGNQLTPRNILILGASLLYLVSPIDAVSDFIPVIGLLDDLGVLTIALTYVQNVAHQLAANLQKKSSTPAA